MADETGSVVSAKKNIGIAQGIAAGMYYAESGTSKQFESLTAEELKPWFDKAVAVLGCIEKMNMVLVPRTQIKDDEESEKAYLERLTLIIQGFVKSCKTTKPALFPSAELAHRILNGGINGKV